MLYEHAKTLVAQVAVNSLPAEYVMGFIGGLFSAKAISEEEYFCLKQTLDDLAK